MQSNIVIAKIVTMGFITDFFFLSTNSERIGHTTTNLYVLFWLKPVTLRRSQQEEPSDTKYDLFIPTIMEINASSLKNAKFRKKRL